MVRSYVNFDTNAVIAFISKRSAEFIQKHHEQIRTQLVDIVEEGRKWLIREFLDKPRLRKNNTPYPRRRTGNLIRALSFTIRKTRDESMLKISKRTVQYSVKQVWAPLISKSGRDYGVILDTSRRYTTRGYKYRLAEHMSDYIKRKLK